MLCTPGAGKVIELNRLQTEVEDFEGSFFEVDETMRVAAFLVDRDVIARAMELVSYRKGDQECPCPCHDRRVSECAESAKTVASRDVWSGFVPTGPRGKL
jgi:hypothetical protein